MMLSAPFDCATLLCFYHTNSLALRGATTKNNNRQYWQSPINNFGQQHLNGATDWSTAEDGNVLPHFRQIVSGASTPPCTMVAVI
jgi:hypothetical protein